MEIDSGTPNNTYLNNFDIFNKVLKKIQIKIFEIKNLICTPTHNKGLFYKSNTNKVRKIEW